MICVGLKRMMKNDAPNVSIARAENSESPSSVTDAAAARALRSWALDTRRGL